MTVPFDQCVNDGTIGGIILQEDGEPAEGVYMYLDKINTGSGRLSVYARSGHSKVMARTDSRGCFFLEFVWSGIHVGIASQTMTIRIQAVDVGSKDSRFVGHKAHFVTTGKAKRLVSFAKIAGLSGDSIISSMKSDLLKSYDEHKKTRTYGPRRTRFEKPNRSARRGPNRPKPRTSNRVRHYAPDNLLSRTPSGDMLDLIAVVGGQFTSSSRVTSRAQVIG